MGDRLDGGIRPHGRAGAEPGSGRAVKPAAAPELSGPMLEASCRSDGRRKAPSLRRVLPRAGALPLDSGVRRGKQGRLWPRTTHVHLFRYQAWTQYSLDKVGGVNQIIGPLVGT